MGKARKQWHRWGGKFDEDAVATRSAEGQTVEQEVRRLRKEVEQLRMDTEARRRRERRAAEVSQP